VAWRGAAASSGAAYRGWPGWSACTPRTALLFQGLEAHNALGCRPLLGAMPLEAQKYLHSPCGLRTINRASGRPGARAQPAYTPATILLNGVHAL